MSFKIQTQFLIVSLVFPVQLRMQAFSLWKQDMHSIAHQEHSWRCVCNQERIEDIAGQQQNQ